MPVPPHRLRDLQWEKGDVIVYYNIGTQLILNVYGFLTCFSRCPSDETTKVQARLKRTIIV